MKNVVFAFSVCIAIFSGCYAPPNPPEMIGPEIRHYRMNVYVQRLEFDGHRYIWVWSYDRGGLEHDPDCKCHAKQAEFRLG